MIPPTQEQREMADIMRRYGRIGGSIIDGKFTYSFWLPFDSTPCINHTAADVCDCIEPVYNKVRDYVWSQCLIEEASGSTRGS